MNSKPLPQTLPDTDTIALARTSAEELSRLLADKPRADRAQVRLDGHDLILPRQALALLRDLLADMAQGHAVTIVPMHAELTTQEAANLLNVSRPYFVGLLEAGTIPFTKVGTHRRVRYEHLIAYKNQRDKESQELLDELTRQAQELKMG
ncbi:MAG: helix-turn-helix domain-containing protein [Xanthomonadaceae bacterium]|nr:helix-turn-helix domain-containing protein [Xanthomonadaceae bacterium]